MSRTPAQIIILPNANVGKRGYADLVADLIIANQKLMEYRRQLHRLATGVEERKLDPGG